MVQNIIDNKTVTYAYFYCTFKDYSPCELKFEIEDSLGNVVFRVDSIQNATYKVSMVMTGEYKFSFSNQDVPSDDAVARKALVAGLGVLLLRQARAAELRDEGALQREGRQTGTDKADDKPADGVDGELEAHRGELREQ
jgi:hypothetical protein